MLHLLLLLLLTSPTLQQRNDSLTFFGKLICMHQRQWCWKLEAWEFDTFEPNDHLGTHEGCTEQPSVLYNIVNFQDGDGFSLHYKLGLSVTHTCTLNGAPHDKWLGAIWTVNIGDEEPYYLEFDITLR